MDTTTSAEMGLVYGSDLRVGQTYELGSHIIDERTLVEFACAWDPLSIHTDRQAAASGPYGGLIASGIHTIAVYQRLAVRKVFYNWSVIAARNLREVRFLRPVRVGDVLTGTVTIKDIEFDDRDRVLVTTVGELFNQADKPVLSLRVHSYMHARPT